jgi:hypothetical protein
VLVLVDKQGSLALTVEEAANGRLALRPHATFLLPALPCDANILGCCRSAVLVSRFATAVGLLLWSRVAQVWYAMTATTDRMILSAMINGL